MGGLRERGCGGSGFLEVVWTSLVMKTGSAREHLSPFFGSPSLITPHNGDEICP